MLGGFDYGRAEDQVMVTKQFGRDEPWLTVFAWPCAWGSWARIHVGRGGAGADNVADERVAA